MRVTSEGGLIEGWKQHFDEVLNLPGLQSAIDENGEGGAGHRYRTPPCVNDIITSSKRLRNGKVPGIDNIRVEALTMGVGITAGTFEQAFT